MNGCSHPNHENRIVTTVPRIRASPRHGGARQFLEFFSHLNRRGVAPSGAAALIATVNNVLLSLYLIIMIYRGNAHYF
jgi:hypothetical protein